MKFISKRKVALIGNGLYLSLPRSWTREQGIEKGEEITVIHDKGKLIIEKGKVKN